MRVLCCGRYRLPLERPLVMGIVNLTPDSFSGDGVGRDVQAALRHAERQRLEGADLLDLGAESTRPGAEPVPSAEEMSRLLPVLRVVRDWGIPISIDTSKPEVMRAALDEGADMINDVNALRAPGAVAIVAGSSAAVCLMHMQNDPRTMQIAPSYVDVVAEVGNFLQARARACEAAGIGRERILIDPGFGFGKTVAHNYQLLRALPTFADLGWPLLVGLSRKSMLGAVTGKPAGPERAAVSVAAAVLAAERGAKILRVHDVGATRDALAILRALWET